MALFARPTFDELLTRIQSDIDARLDGTDSRLRRSVLNIISYVLAGLAHALYGFLDWLSRQLFVDTAETEFLNRFGVVWGVERLQAVQAKGNITFTGTDGTIIPANTELQRSDSALYITDVFGTIVSGNATVAITADEPGIDGNTVADSTFTFLSPIADVNSEAIVAIGGIVDGIDLEDDDSYLERILLTIQQPPQGGASIDYEIWSLAANPAVTNVFVYPLEDGVGTVTVRFMAYGSTANGIPTPELVTEVQDYINSRAPVTAMVTVIAPTASPLNITIDNLLINDGFVLADVQADIINNIADMLHRDAIPGGTIYRNIIIENILATDGVFNADLTIPATDVTTSAGIISTVGTVTWI